MLRPKKKMTMKEIKRDPFLEFIAGTKLKLTEKKNLVFRITAVIVLIFILYSLFSRSQESKKLEADNLLGRAMVYVDVGDNDNAVLNLQNLLDEYGRTDAGITANYYLGKLYFDQDNAALAEPLFTYFVKKSSHPILRSAAAQVLVSIYKSSKNYDSALEYQKIAVENASNPEAAALFMLKSAELSLEMGDFKSAREKVDKILNTWEKNFDIIQAARELEGWIYVKDD